MTHWRGISDNPVPGAVRKVFPKSSPVGGRTQPLCRWVVPRFPLLPP
jgi:hypothetical protein